MGMGAVPIVTRASGTEDDIIDGDNGYIVDIGDIDSFIGRIAYLYENRRVLCKMGKLAMKTVRSKYTDDTNFWRELLEYEG